jgi:hypothetical protein
MRQTISGIVAAIAVVAASAVPAMACGYGGCSPCGQVSPCAQPQVYVAPVAPSYGSSGCDTGCGWARERLPDPVQQYYYVNQGPTYTGPGNWAPRPTYQEGAVSYQRPYYGYRAHRAYRPWYPRANYYHAPRMNYRYGYAPRHNYAARYAPAPYRYGHRPLRRYY